MIHELIKMDVMGMLEKCGAIRYMGGGAPKAPPPPSPPPTETSSDIAQEESAERRRSAGTGGRTDTILSQRTNPAGQTGTNTLLGE
jgi:hypothetical protein